MVWMSNFHVFQCIRVFYNLSGIQMVFASITILIQTGLIQIKLNGSLIEWSFDTGQVLVKSRLFGPAIKCQLNLITRLIFVQYSKGLVLHNSDVRCKEIIILHLL